MQDSVWAAVQTSDFDVGTLYTWLRGDSSCATDGAIVTFTGVVRDSNAQASLRGIELEHYSEMTLPALRQLAATAQSRFSLGRVVVLHRIGVLATHEQIVFVGATSPHRQAAFDGAQFLMDRLKSDIPLWKKELHSNGDEQWVMAKTRDSKAAQRWDSESQT
ncbi:molybdenum cofactor biosynthesis protein MoaE [Alteromonas oceanisediminis]|uniref:molybdenum cofactor biosynthesis protein MoaE n=1 Tax=Alteromonas oceanisediminis TaxID=2836180 RepID=UPI001BDA8248|nr:molybdenum cofactor biosynthesis protein MoaE [Alteromonas oceanisediminis]MBT0587339.1 molybdenum cofactor biosynthesis protein MoaE [Alteromonas oceanisediminis]